MGRSRVFIVVFVLLVGVSIVGTSVIDSPFTLPLSRTKFTDLGQVRVTAEQEDENWDHDWDFMNPNSDGFDLLTNWIQLNRYCSTDDTFVTISCYGLHSKGDLPLKRPEFSTIRNGIFANISIQQGVTLGVNDFYGLFPNLESLSLIGSPRVTYKFLRDVWTQYDYMPRENGIPGSSGRKNTSGGGNSNSNGNGINNSGGIQFEWRTVRKLDLSGNELQSRHFPFTLTKVFPNLKVLNLRKNNITTLANIPQMSLNQLKFIDLSENPLDCTSTALEWVDRPNITLINVENTFCDKPAHQNKPKPILPTIRLIKKVKSECRVNCSCEIDYIWEQDKVIYSKTAVNCTNKGFYDFPDPEDLPKPTDTLYLNTNQIHSIEKFAQSYDDVGIRNLYLENNAISNINMLETSDWIYSFQVLSLRNNSLTDIPIHMLENIMRENERIYLMDLSHNNWKCNCRTVSTFKVWLLRHSKFIKNVEEVRCERNKNEIRYLKNEDWCKQDEVSQMIELLDLFSIFLGCCIILVIAKVSYDYYNFKRFGKVPWIVRKM